MAKKTSRARIREQNARARTPKKPTTGRSLTSDQMRRMGELERGLDQGLAHLMVSGAVLGLKWLLSRRRTVTEWGLDMRELHGTGHAPYGAWVRSRVDAPGGYLYCGNRRSAAVIKMLMEGLPEGF